MIQVATLATINTVSTDQLADPAKRLSTNHCPRPLACIAFAKGNRQSITTGTMTLKFSLYPFALSNCTFEKGSIIRSMAIIAIIAVFGRTLIQFEAIIKTIIMPMMHRK